MIRIHDIHYPEMGHSALNEYFYFSFFKYILCKYICTLGKNVLVTEYFFTGLLLLLLRCYECLSILNFFEFLAVGEAKTKQNIILIMTLSWPFSLFFSIF